jgi:ethanolamine utilization protein EutN
MIIARVCGNIYSTINHKFYDNKRLLIVEPLTVQGKSSGKYLIAVDSVDAGDGEKVLVLEEGNSARQIVNDKTAPIRSIIIGIIDDINTPK